MRDYKPTMPGDTPQKELRETLDLIGFNLGDAKMAAAKDRRPADYALLATAYLRPMAAEIARCVELADGLAANVSGKCT